MWPNSQCPADLVAFTGEILNKKLHFLYSETGDHVCLVSCGFGHNYWRNP